MNASIALFVTSTLSSYADAKSEFVILVYNT